MKTLKVFKILLFIIILHLSLFNLSFGYTGDKLDNGEKVKTIRYLKNKLNKLNNKNDDLKAQVEKMIKETGNLKNFFRDDLSQKELSDLKEIFSLYKIYSNRINKKFNKNIKKLVETEEEKKKLLLEKSLAYKRLTKYIKIEKKEEFLEFIKSDLEITKEKKDLEENLYKNNNALSRKVAIIKEKIKENNQILDEKLRKLITEKVNEKIENLKNNPKFKTLTNKEKKAVFNKSISKINMKIKQMKNNLNDLNKKKLELYNIIKNRLIELNNSLE
ncbi:hypothetical protein CSB07_01750 [Candidatus Gracilibacteria bacterium]|nr:MAG: hypothetical protein CSB07_01750 [Candidatus Gracilibacteria bacterium]PIE85194.1 MAG: hypothetical protein CSA08_02960 [Candidatus Gracilibacteria bacterium]